MPLSLKEKTARGLLWGGIGNGALQVLNLVFGIFLSRLLSPSDYGMVGALTIFSALAGIFAESGFILAIVNKKEANHDDYNAVFWFNVAIGLSMYLILFACAPLIARFYHTPELAPLARFLFLSFLVGSTTAAPIAYYFRNLMVKERSQIQIVAILISGIVGVACAYHGWGYWGIALQTVVYSGMNALLIWIRSPWRPTLTFRMRPLLDMLPFSSKLLFTSIFTHINNNIFSVLLGRFYTMQQVGYYTQGSKWTTMGYSTMTGMINSVGQPVFREASNDRARLQNIFHKMLRFTVFVSFPAMFGLGIIAEELIVITITDKWLPCAPVMQILCVWGAFMPVSTLYSNLLNSLGRPNIYMWNTIGLGIFQLLCVWFSYPYGLHVMLTAFTAANILWLGIWQHFAYKHAGIRLLHVLKDIVPYLIITLAVMAATWLATSGIGNLYLRMGCKILMAAALYTLLMWRLKSVIFKECIQYLFAKKKGIS